MTAQNEPPGPPGWQKEHMQRYVATNGEDGYLWHGVPTLLLTTRSERSNQPRTTPLIFGQDGGRYLVVASRGGAPKHPQWYRNLVAHPDVEVQVRGERFHARARTAGPDEKPRLWKIMAAIYRYDELQSRTNREIPVIIVERS